MLDDPYRGGGRHLSRWARDARRGDTVPGAALLAKIAAAVDEISNGRLTLGVGAGWDEAEFRAFGYPFDHLAGRFGTLLAALSQACEAEQRDPSTVEVMVGAEIAAAGASPAEPLAVPADADAVASALDA